MVNIRAGLNLGSGLRWVIERFIVIIGTKLGLTLELGSWLVCARVLTRAKVKFWAWFRVRGINWHTDLVRFCVSIITKFRIRVRVGFTFKARVSVGD